MEGGTQVLLDTRTGLACKRQASPIHHVDSEAVGWKDEHPSTPKTLNLLRYYKYVRQIDLYWLYIWFHMINAFLWNRYYWSYEKRSNRSAFCVSGRQLLSLCPARSNRDRAAPEKAFAVSRTRPLTSEKKGTQVPRHSQHWCIRHAEVVNL